MALQSQTEIYIGSTKIESFKRFVLNQDINAHHFLQLECRTDVLEELNSEISNITKNYLGETIKLQVASLSGYSEYKELLFKGVVTSITNKKGYNNQHMVTITAQSPTVLCDDGANYNSYIDSEETRINWIKTRPDFGQLYFKQGLMLFETTLALDRERIVRELEQSIVKHKSLMDVLEKSIDKEKTKLIASNNKCVTTNYISKEYYTIESLRNDNNKAIKVDKDKQRIGESDIVPIDSYALLRLDNGNKKIFKRDKLSNGNEIWNLESGINIDDETFKQIIKAGESLKIDRSKIIK